MKRSEPPDVRAPISGCDTENPPPGYEIVKKDDLTLWEQCQEYWIKAREEVATLGFSNEFERQSAIRILEKRYPMGIAKRDPRNIEKIYKQRETICYNPNFLQQRGWCEIRRSTEIERKWGICSTSCEEYYKYRGTFNMPPIYHDIHLRLSSADRDSPSSTGRWNMRRFLNKALSLSRPVYPEQKIWTFESSVVIQGRQELQATFQSIGPTNVDVSKKTKFKLFGNVSSIYIKSTILL